MTDILTQDEIDKLLKSGLGGGGDEPEEPASPPPQESFAAPTPPPQSAFANVPQMDQGLPSFDSIMGMKKSTSMKRTAIVSEEDRVNVQAASFPVFDQHDPASENTELGTILEIKLEMRVELGKTHSTLREVLDMGVGSVIELDKQNGEPVDMVVNKKGFAKGEMIVIGENFGARITDILSVHEIIEALR